MEKLQKYITKKNIIFVLCSIVIFLLLAILYYRLSKAYIGLNSSDDASIIMQAKDFLSGNLLLKNWTLPSDTFYLTDLPFYIITVKLLGIREAVLHITPVIIFLIVILLGYILTIADNKEKYVAKFAILLILLGFPTTILASIVLRGPDHFATNIFLLLSIILVYFYTKAKTKIYLLLISISLVILQVCISFSDPLFITISLIPLIIFSAIKTNFFKGELQYKYLWLFFSGIASFICVILLKSAVYASGANILKIPILTFFSFDNLWGYLIWAVKDILNLYGANFENMVIMNVNNYQTFFRFGLFCFMISILFYRLRQKKKDDSIDTLLTFSICTNILGCILTSTLSSERYVSPSIVLFAILTARTFVYYPLKWKYTLLTFLTFYIVFTYYQFVKLNPVVSADQAVLLTYLQNHQLTNGYGDYWSATYSDVLSKGKVIIAPIMAKGSVLTEYNWLSTTAWYNTNKIQFVVYDMNNPYTLTDDTIKTTFGIPDNIVLVSHYKISIWRHPLTHLTLYYDKDNTPQ